MPEDPISPIRILHVEDVAADSQLVAEVLDSQGLVCEIERVDREAALRAALLERGFDIVISDFSLPGWSGMDALRMVNELRPGLPFVFVSGSIGEDAAIDMLRRGATDYVLKERLTRLVPAIQRALAESGERRRRQEAEARLLRAQRLESIGAMAGGIAHDLNNVLSPILMSVEVMRRRLSPDDTRTAALLDRIESSAKRGADMVKQILLFARGSEGEHQSVDLRQLLADVVRLAQETFPKSIRVLAQPEQVAPVRGDATQLHQVLLNLCVNARDAMPQGGTLRLKTELRDLDAGRYVCISVSDDGEGVPEALRERIFEPFFTTKPPGLGTGLGLSTSLAIVKNHRGFMSLENRREGGSTFHVHLPVAEAAAAGAPALPFADAPAGRGELVLLVDDEEMIMDLARETLEASGYRVLCARNGKQALEVLAGSGLAVDAVVTDLSMPVMDGLALIEALRAVAPGARAILSSGQEPPSAYDGPLLRKPFTVVELLSVLRRTLDA